MDCTVRRTSRIPAGSSVPLLARVVDGVTESPITAAQIQTVALRIVDMKTKAATTPAISDPSAVIKPLTAWSKDEIGYNFRYDAKPTELVAGDRVYQYQFTFTPTDVSAQPFKLVIEVPTFAIG